MSLTYDECIDNTRYKFMVINMIVCKEKLKASSADSSRSSKRQKHKRYEMQLPPQNVHSPESSSFSMQYVQLLPLVENANIKIHMTAQKWKP